MSDDALALAFRAGLPFVGPARPRARSRARRRRPARGRGRGRRACRSRPSDDHVRLAVAHPGVDLSALAPYIGERRVELAIASRAELEAIVGPPRPVEQAGRRRSRWLEEQAHSRRSPSRGGGAGRRRGARGGAWRRSPSLEPEPEAEEEPEPFRPSPRRRRSPRPEPAPRGAGERGGARARGGARGGGPARGALQGAAGRRATRRGAVLARAAEPGAARPEGPAGHHPAARDRRAARCSRTCSRAEPHARARSPTLAVMAADTISFARGAPSLDIVDVEGLKEAAARAFANDPGGTTAYGTAIGYAPLRAWIAEQHGVEPAQGGRHQRLDAGRRVPVRRARRAQRHGRRRAPDLRPHAARACASAWPTSAWSSSSPTASTSTASRR